MPLAPLLASIRAQESGSSRPVVSLEEFFEGNTSVASMGCNLSPHPGIATFYAVLRSIRDRDDVQDVLVGIAEDMGDTEWPFSDSVYVLTRAQPDEVERWAAQLEPDPNASEGYHPGAPTNAPALLPDHRVVTLWWD
jgi:hypothetical protein